VVQWIAGLELSTWQVMLILIGATLVIGCFMEGLAILVIVTPVLMPLLNHVGIDPIHFGIVLTIGIMIGNITPPVGLILYVVMALGRVSIVALSREMAPFFIALLGALLIVPFSPTLSLWLPDLLIPAS
jgi:TRAP-type C4-dicarboxylate transport system permease large subunit